MFFVIVHGAATRELRLEVRDVVYDLLVSQVGVKKSSFYDDRKHFKPFGK